VASSSSMARADRIDTPSSSFSGAHVLLAPTVNTQRSPLGGRGFESFSEVGVVVSPPLREGVSQVVLLREKANARGLCSFLHFTGSCFERKHRCCLHQRSSSEGSSCDDQALRRERSGVREVRLSLFLPFSFLSLTLCDQTLISRLLFHHQAVHRRHSDRACSPRDILQAFPSTSTSLVPRERDSTS